MTGKKNNRPNFNDAYKNGGAVNRRNFESYEEEDVHKIIREYFKEKPFKYVRGENGTSPNGDEKTLQSKEENCNLILKYLSMDNIPVLLDKTYNGHFETPEHIAAVSIYCTAHSMGPEYEAKIPIDKYFGLELDFLAANWRKYLEHKV